MTTASLQKSGSLQQTRGGFKLHCFKEDLTRGLFTKLKSGYVERTRSIRCRAVTLPSVSRARRLEVGASCGDRHLKQSCALGSRGSRSAATLRRCCRRKHSLSTARRTGPSPQPSTAWRRLQTGCGGHTEDPGRAGAGAAHRPRAGSGSQRPGGRTKWACRCLIH